MHISGVLKCAFKYGILLNHVCYKILLAQCNNCLIFGCNTLVVSFYVQGMILECSTLGVGGGL